MSVAKFISYADCDGIECVLAVARVVNNACIQCDWFCIISLNYGSTPFRYLQPQVSGLRFHRSARHLCCCSLGHRLYRLCTRLMVAIILFFLFKYYIEIIVPLVFTFHAFDVRRPPPLTSLNFIESRREIIRMPCIGWPIEKLFA